MVKGKMIRLWQVILNWIFVIPTTDYESFVKELEAEAKAEAKAEAEAKADISNECDYGRDLLKELEEDSLWTK